MYIYRTGKDTISYGNFSVSLIGRLFFPFNFYTHSPHKNKYFGIVQVSSSRPLLDRPKDSLEMRSMGGSVFLVFYHRVAFLTKIAMLSINIYACTHSFDRILNTSILNILFKFDGCIVCGITAYQNNEL